jgi:4-hydroxy-2-oxoheptanedioate aldolase
MRAMSLRERWSRGETAVNAWLMLAGPTGAEAVATAGFDAVTVDLQHGHATERDLAATAAAIEAHGAVPMARLRWNDPPEIMRVLDLGVRGLICPMVGSAEETRALVDASRYPPAGQRSYGPIVAAYGAGRDHVEAARERTFVFAMIETATGLEHVDAIASTPGLDGLYVGPADLSLSLGLSTFADLGDPVLLEVLDRVVAVASAHRIVAGIHAPSPEGSIAMAARGFRFVTPAVDADLLGAGARAALATTREGVHRS